MSIMDFFKAPPAESNNNSNPQSTVKDVKVPESNKPLSQNNPSVGEDGKMPGTDNTTQNPLDVYSKMFDNANKETEGAPAFKIDPKILNDVSGKMNFTQGIDPELMQKASSGDVNALLSIINITGQNAYRASLEHGTALTDTFLTHKGGYDKKQLESGVKQQLTSNELSSAPNYSHPVVKAELNRVAAQFSRANPDASPQEVAQAARKYINDLQLALNPKASSPETKDGEMDWSKYLS